MTIKYHVNPATGNPNKCDAKYSCRFASRKDHYDTKEDARAGYEKIMRKKELAEARRTAPIKEVFKKDANATFLRDPIDLTPMTTMAPSTWSNDLIDATDIEPAGYYGNDGYTSFNEVRGDRAVELETGIYRRDWPEDLEEIYQENKEEWNNTANWDAEYGYYEGETPYVNAPPSLNSKLREWYYNQPNAADEHGILEHVRGKGFETQGLEPIEAVKKLLREENGMTLTWVENCSSARENVVDLDKLRISKKHYEAVDSREPKPTLNGTKEFLGVAHYSDKDGYRLLDGYHRLKHAKENGVKNGRFIVIS